MSLVHTGYAALIPILLAAGGAGLFAIRSASSKLRAAMRWTGAGTLVMTAAVWVARWVEVEHFPLFGTYENALSMALAVLVAAVWFDLRRGDLVALPVTSIVAAFLLVHGIQYDAMAYGLTISERSLVVDLHAVLAWLAFGVLAVAFAIACRVALPARESRLERHLVRSLTAGFVLHSAMIASGALYKFMLFGRVWSWDPIETMALIAWLAYGTLLHMPLLAGWGPQRLARWSLLTFVVLVVSYRAIIYFPSFATYHVFDIGLKLHL